MKIVLPEGCLVVLVGPAGAGKTTFARRYFGPTEILSSDAFRAMVGDDENDLAATNDAFEGLHAIAAKRLKRGRVTVVDATNVDPESRVPLLAMARAYGAAAVAVVLDMPPRVSRERNAARHDRTLGRHVVAGQRAQLRRSLAGLEGEGFQGVFVLRSPEEVNSVEVVRGPGASVIVLPSPGEGAATRTTPSR